MLRHAGADEGVSGAFTAAAINMNRRSAAPIEMPVAGQFNAPRPSRD